MGPGGGPGSQAIGFPEFVKFVCWWSGEFLGDGNSIIAHISMQDGFPAPPGTDPWFDMVSTRVSDAVRSFL